MKCRAGKIFLHSNHSDRKTFGNLIVNLILASSKLIGLSLKRKKLNTYNKFFWPHYFIFHWGAVNWHAL